ncbi:MAG: aspartyl/asparaginyl-tRNA synthetase, aspartyl-tRNA synthetase [Candidatus Parcubacteria bacterium]|jgi:aspartyl-tRNA synthetase
MERTFVELLPQCIDQVVRIAGFVEKIRALKTMQFVVVQDRTGSVQVSNQLGRVRSGLEVELGVTLEEEINTLTPGSTIEVIGTVKANPAVKLGGLEVVPQTIVIHGIGESPLPLDSKSGPEVRLDWRFLDLRSPRNLLIFKIQTAAEHAMRSFWKSEGFVELHSPKFMGSASESGAELFRVEYFDRTAYLAQSPQFYKQMAMAAGFDRVFEIGPVFRANPSFTSRHDTEFTSVDVEISWIESHEDVMRLEERWLRHVLGVLKDELGDAIKTNFGIEVVVPETPFPRVTMEEAYEILGGMGHRIERGEKGDLDPEGERLLCQHFNEKAGHEFVFVTEYPAAVRPFYHMRNKYKPHVTKSFDLLWKGLEVTTGAQREHRYGVLVEQAREKGVSLEPIQYYLDFFRYGCPPHGGYGFGLTRMLMVLLGLKNVREATYVYRGVNRLTP